MRDRLLLKYGFNKFIWLRKLLTLLYSFLEHLSFAFDSKAAIYKAAEKSIEENRPDYIIATGEPFILFKYAGLLSAKYKIPWIADYRDGWTTNQGNYESGFVQKLQMAFFRNREKKYVANALLVTTASPAYAAALRQIHTTKEVKVVYNGYDEEYFQNIDSISAPADKFIITYAGTVYPHQNIEMFLDGLSDFITKEKITKGNLEIRFYGLESQSQAKERILNYQPDLKNFILPLGKVPYPDLVKAMRASHLLLLLSKKGADWLNAKVFDYLAVKRKIVLVENDAGVLEDLLKQTEGGAALNSSAEVSALLKDEYLKFKSGQNSFTGPNETCRRYSRRTQALHLAEILLKNLPARAGN
jgi:glycosyltransferase involved in cell wall biosynthesis